MATFLFHEIQARRQQTTGILAHAALKAGLAARIRSHDLRRGAARDMSMLNLDTTEGLPTEVVPQGLGLSLNAHKAGVTQLYIGDAIGDLYTKRVKKDWQDSFGLPTTDSDFYRPRKRTAPSDITAFCEQQGLDPTNSEARQTASLQIRTEEQETWRKNIRSECMLTLFHFLTFKTSKAC